MNSVTVWLGSDHGGYQLKESLKLFLKEQGAHVEDCGAHHLKPSDDYPEFSHDVARALGEATHGERCYGILLCRSGQGMAMAANRHSHIRAAVVWNESLARETRRDNDANVLVLPADFVSDRQAKAIVTAFITTQFSGEQRHVRRIAQITPN